MYEGISLEPEVGEALGGAAGRDEKKGGVTTEGNKLNGNFRTLVRSGAVSSRLKRGTALSVGSVRPGHNRPEGAFDRRSLSRLTSDVERRKILRPLLMELVPSNDCHLITNRHHFHTTELTKLCRIPIAIHRVASRRRDIFTLVRGLRHRSLGTMRRTRNVGALVSAFNFARRRTTRGLKGSHATIAGSLELLGLPSDINSLLGSNGVSVNRTETLLTIRSRTRVGDVTSAVIGGNVSIHRARQLTGGTKGNNATTMGEGGGHSAFCSRIRLTLTKILTHEIGMCGNGNSNNDVRVRFFNGSSLGGLTRRLRTLRWFRFWFFKKEGVLSVGLMERGPSLMGRGVGGGFRRRGLTLMSRMVRLSGGFHRSGRETSRLHTSEGGVDGRVNNLVTGNLHRRTRGAGRGITRLTGRLRRLRNDRRALSTRVGGEVVIVPGVVNSSIPVNGSSDRGMRLRHFNRPCIPPFRVPCRMSVVRGLRKVSLSSTEGADNGNFCCLYKSVTELRSTILSCTHSFVVSENFACCIPPFVVEKGIIGNIVDFSRVRGVVCGVRNRSLCLVNASRRSVVNGFVSAVAPRTRLPGALADCSPYFHGRINTRNVRRQNMCHVRRFRGRRVIIIYGPRSDSV